jgi:hypothetical protein
VDMPGCGALWATARRATLDPYTLVAPWAQGRGLCLFGRAFRRPLQGWMLCFAACLSMPLGARNGLAPGTTRLSGRPWGRCLLQPWAELNEFSLQGARYASRGGHVGFGTRNRLRPAGEVVVQSVSIMPFARRPGVTRAKVMRSLPDALSPRPTPEWTTALGGT